MREAPDQTAGHTIDPADAAVARHARPTRVRLLLTVLLAAAVIQAPEDARGLTSAFPSAPDASHSRFLRSGGDNTWRGRGAPTTRAWRARHSAASPDGARQPAARLSGADVAHHPAGVPFYARDVLRTVFLDFDTPDWERELSSRYRTGEDVLATVTIDGQTYREVGVRFRGNSSYRQVPAGYKRSLNLALDAVREDQQVGGYRTLNLLNASGDPTFVRTVLYAEIASHYTPIPKVNFVRVVINGESWGVYLNAQQFNKDFTRDAFATSRGARWKVPGSPRGRAGLEYLGESPDLYKHLYEIKSKDDEQAWLDLVRLCRLLNTVDPPLLESAISPLLDVDATLRFLAIEAALVNSDGYWARASDYNIYQDVDGRFHVIPYDFNEALGAGGGRRAGLSSGPHLDPLMGIDDPARPLRSRLLAVPRLRARYLGYVADIARNWLDWRALEPKVRRYQSLIEPDVRADGRKLYSTEAFDPEGLRHFVEERRTFLMRYQAPQGEQ